MIDAFSAEFDALRKGAALAGVLLAVPATDPQRAAAAALDAAADHVGPARTLVLVTSLKDPYGVELGGDVPPTHALGMLEMALLKLRRAHRL